MENFKTRRRRYRAIAIFFGSLFIISALLAWSINSIHQSKPKTEDSTDHILAFCESLFEEEATRPETTADEINQCNDQLATIHI